MATNARHRLLARSLGLFVGIISLAGCGSTDNPMDSLTKGLLPPTPGEAARDAFNVYDPDKRRQAVNLLSAAKFGGEEAYVKMYRILIDDPDATVRAACIKALGMHGTVEDVPLIVNHAGDAAAFVRWEVAQSLGKIHNPAAIAPLVKLMTRDEDGDVRMSAAAALGQYAEPAVFNALVSALDDTDYGVVVAAQQSLKTITGYDFGIDPAMWLIYQDKNSGKVFVHQQPYRWTPYQKPVRWYQRAMFWSDRTPPEPRPATGMTEGAVAPVPKS